MRNSYNVTIFHNVDTGEYYFSLSHGQRTTSDSWVPCTHTIPQHVTPRPSLPDGIVKDIKDLVTIFYSDERDVEIENPDPRFRFPNKLNEIDLFILKILTTTGLKAADATLERQIVFFRPHHRTVYLEALANLYTKVIEGVFSIVDEEVQKQVSETSVGVTKEQRDLAKQLLIKKFWYTTESGEIKMVLFEDYISSFPGLNAKNDGAAITMIDGVWYRIVFDDNGLIIGKVQIGNESPDLKDGDIEKESSIFRKWLADQTELPKHNKPYSEVWKSICESRQKSTDNEAIQNVAYVDKDGEVKTMSSDTQITSVPGLSSEYDGLAVTVSEGKLYRIVFDTNGSITEKVLVGYGYWNYKDVIVELKFRAGMPCNPLTDRHGNIVGRTPVKDEDKKAIMKTLQDRLPTNLDEE